jgi:hypothetical protein
VGRNFTRKQITGVVSIIALAIFAATAATATAAGTHAQQAQQAQGHAPTLEQCRADRDLWMFQIPKGSFALTAHKELREYLTGFNSDTLLARQVEMTNCMMAIDPMPVESANWASANSNNLTATLLAHEQHVLDRDKWERYVLLRLVYAEEIEERLIAIHKSKK